MIGALDLHKSITVYRYKSVFKGDSLTPLKEKLISSSKSTDRQKKLEQTRLKTDSDSIIM